MSNLTIKCKMKKKIELPEISPRSVKRGHLFAVFYLSSDRSGRSVRVQTVSSVAKCLFVPPFESAPTIFEQVGAYLDIIDEHFLGCLEIRNDLSALISSVLSCHPYAVVEWQNDRGVWCLDGIKNITL